MADDGTIDVSAALTRADASYRAILAFDGWAASDLDTKAWDSARLRLAAVRDETDPADVAAALTERLRAAAVDTGAIEGLYATDRGFTLSVAQETISLDQAEVEKGAEFRRNFEAQLAGFELALDVATSATPISEALIRRLHEVTCAGQPAHRVITSHGVQERQLVLGSYKTEPNHVQLGDGSFHAYAPVDEVAHEMWRLVEQVRSSEFESAHPVVQAAYAHHALTSIHPFADGNGRVARLLASIWLLRAASIPLWVEPTDRDRYLDALEAADLGDRARFVEVIGAVTLRQLRELAEWLDVVPIQSRIDNRSRTRQGRRALMDEIGTRAADRFDGEAGTLGRRHRVQVPTGIEFGSTFEFQHVHPLRSWIAAGIDWSAPSSSRFLVSVGPVAGGGRKVGDPTVAFDESEVVPSLAPSVLRRLNVLFDRLVAELQDV